MYSRDLILASLVLATLTPLGCAPTRYDGSLIHPHSSDRPFQECSIDLSYYKPAQDRPNQDPNIACALAASGGGYRAANFAAGALLGLEEIANSADTSRNALSEVDYFSSVSGGGFAIATYISTLHDHLYFTGSTAGYSFADALTDPNCPCPCSRRPPFSQSCDPCAKEHLQGLYSDFIAEFLRTIFFWDSLGFDNRGQRFEQAIDDDTLGFRWRKRKLLTLPDPDFPSIAQSYHSPTLTLADVFVPADDGSSPTLPYWFANAAVYENAVIFPFSPDHLRLYGVTGYNHRRSNHKFTPASQSYDDFLFDVPISAAVASSANFPFAMRAGRFISDMDPNNPYLYLLDGGIADNLAVITAIRLLNEKSDSAPAKVLIVVDSFQGCLAPFSNISRPPPEADTGVRIMETGLDTWRARYREIIDTLCLSKNIIPVYISFDDLLDTDFNDLIPFGLTSRDIKDLCSGKPKNCPHLSPFHLARSISMTAPLLWNKHGLQYRLSPAQQNLLLASGRFVVHKKRTVILSAFRWN